MYTANPPLICSQPTVLQMERVSDHSATDMSAYPISDAGSFFLPVPPFLVEQWTTPWTPDTPADSYRHQVNAEVGSLISCGTTALHRLTQIFRWSPFVETARSYLERR
jgi:hypothetical protein